MRRMHTSIMRDIAYAAAMPKTLKRMAATPFAARCPARGRSKIEFGNVKVSFASAVDYEAFPGQEYMCTEKAKETYLCEKLIFQGKP